jgi:RNA polymerase sigma-70 factor, ECF subfamily
MSAKPNRRFEGDGGRKTEDIWMQTGPLSQDNSNTANLEFEELVERFYGPLYQFALSLTRSEADASDLTQHAFYTWGIKGQQLRDSSKVGTWLFTTLHRAFLQARRKETRFPHYELDELDFELPWISPDEASQLDGASVLDALAKINDVFRAPLALFYLEDSPYKEIAAILHIPLGTVKSRIARGIAQLKILLTEADYRTDHQQTQEKTEFHYETARSTGLLCGVLHAIRR